MLTCHTQTDAEERTLFHPAQCYTDIVRTADASRRFIAQVTVVGTNHFISQVGDQRNGARTPRFMVGDRFCFQHDTRPRTITAVEGTRFASRIYVYAP